MKKFIATLQQGKEVIKVPCFYIKDKNEAHSIAQKLSTYDKVVGLDIETLKIFKYRNNKEAALEPRLSEIALVQLCYGNNSFIFDPLYCGLGWFGKLKHQTFVAHNGLFELKHFNHNMFKDLNVHCSMIMALLTQAAERSQFDPDPVMDDDEEKAADGAAMYRRMRGASLQASVGRELNMRVGKEMQTSDWSQRPLSGEQLLYAALDSWFALRLYEVLSKKIQEYGMTKVYSLYKSMQYAVVDMELNGVVLDEKEHLELIRNWENESAKYERECRRFFGKLNIRSPKQLGDWLRDTVLRKCAAKVSGGRTEDLDSLNFQEQERATQEAAGVLENWPKTKTGNLAFGKAKIAKYKKSAWVQALLNYKKWDKLCSTYGSSLAEKNNPKTRRLHCGFSIGRTATGRLSSFSPNLQNLPRLPEVRRVFKAGAGRLLVVADYSQIEMRSAGEVSHDSRIREAFAKGQDLHKLIVTHVIGKPLKDVTKEDRQLGKAINFGLLFGMGAKKLGDYAIISYGVDMSFEQAERAYEVFHKVMYPTYSQWCHKIRGECEQSLLVRTPMGKLRKLAESEVYTKAPNTQVQGGAAEVLQCACIILRKMLSDSLPYTANLANNIHDEIWVECNEDEADTVQNLMTEAMRKGMSAVFPKATHNNLVEIGMGKSWQEAKDNGVVV
jgi:DNA polymerase I